MLTTPPRCHLPALSADHFSQLQTQRRPALPLPTMYEPAFAPVATAAPHRLTAEEQLALYELELRSDDPGHQPC